MLTDMKIQTEALADEMMELVKDLYDHPEIGNEEFRSMGVLCDKCRLLGFEVSEGYVVPTGWMAKYDSKDVYKRQVYNRLKAPHRHQHNSAESHWDYDS